MTENAPSGRFEAIMVIILVLLMGIGAIMLFSSCSRQLPYAVDV